MSSTVDGQREQLRRELMRRMLGFASHHHDRLTMKVAQWGLTPVQAKALYFLEATTSMRKLANRLYCDASNLTGIVDRLEELGLIKRMVDPDDRRVKRLHVTPAGARIRDKVAQAMYEVPELDSLTPRQETELHRLVGLVWDQPDPLAE